jgi:hypothetical protein
LCRPKKGKVTLVTAAAKGGKRGFDESSGIGLTRALPFIRTKGCFAEANSAHPDRALVESAKVPLEAMKAVVPWMRVRASSA